MLLQVLVRIPEPDIKWSEDLDSPETQQCLKQYYEYLEGLGEKICKAISDAGFEIPTYKWMGKEKPVVDLLDRWR
jgi:hypothetical protein